MAKAKILSSLVNHLSLESSCIVNSNFSSHLLKNFCKVVSNLDLLLLVVFFSIFLLHLILILLFFVFPFLLFLLLFRFLLLFGLLLLIKKLYLITCANSTTAKNFVFWILHLVWIWCSSRRNIVVCQKIGTSEKRVFQSFPLKAKQLKWPFTNRPNEGKSFTSF